MDRLEEVDDPDGYFVYRPVVGEGKVVQVYEAGLAITQSTGRDITDRVEPSIHHTGTS